MRETFDVRSLSVTHVLGIGLIHVPPWKKMYGRRNDFGSNTYHNTSVTFT